MGMHPDVNPNCSKEGLYRVYEAYPEHATVSKRRGNLLQVFAKNLNRFIQDEVSVKSPLGSPRD